MGRTINEKSCHVRTGPAAVSTVTVAWAKSQIFDARKDFYEDGWQRNIWPIKVPRGFDSAFI